LIRLVKFLGARTVSTGTKDLSKGRPIHTSALFVRLRSTLTLNETVPLRADRHIKLEGGAGGNVNRVSSHRITPVTE